MALSHVYISSSCQIKHNLQSSFPNVWNSSWNRERSDRLKAKVHTEHLRLCGVKSHYMFTRNPRQYCELKSKVFIWIAHVWSRSISWVKSCLSCKHSAAATINYWWWAQSVLPVPSSWMVFKSPCACAKRWGLAFPNWVRFRWKQMRVELIHFQLISLYLCFWNRPQLNHCKRGA